MEDTLIINLYFDRSEEAIQETARKYGKYCYSIAWNILYDKEDSDECVNDTWLATWNCIPPRKPAVLSAFLGKITRNLAIDCFRRKKAAKRSAEHMSELCRELEEIEDVTAHSLNDEIRRKEILQILEKFLDSLHLVTHAVSLGDIESLIVYYDKNSDKLPHYPAIYHEGFFRFSIGLENAEDIIADLKQAMMACGVLA